MAAYQGALKRRKVNVLVIMCFSMIIAHITQLHKTSPHKEAKKGEEAQRNSVVTPYNPQ